MDGKSQEDMGLDSVTNYLAAIANNTKSLNETFNTGVEKLYKLLSSNLGVIKRSFGKVLKYAKRDSDNLDNISSKISSLYEHISFSGDSGNIDKESGKSTKTKHIKIDINGGKLNPEDANKWLKNLATLFELSESKIKKINNMFNTLNSGFIKINKTVRPAAMGLAMFAGSLLLLNLLSFTAIVKLSFGLAALGAGIGFFLNSIIRSLGNKSAFKTFIILRQLPALFIGLGKGILMLSLGLLIFSQVKGAAVGLAVTVGIIVSLFALFNGRKRRTVSMSIDLRIFRFASAIGILVLALYAVQSIPFSAVFVLIGVVIALGLALRLFNKRKGLAGVASKNKSLMGEFAMGMGILVLALYAVKDISFVALFKLVLFVGILGLAIKSTRGASSLTKFAMGFAIMVLAMYAMQVSIDISTLFRVTIFIAALGVVSKLFNKTGAISLLMMSGAILAIGYALSKFADSGFDMMNMLTFTLTVTLFAGLLALLGSPPMNVLIGIGSVILGLMGVSLYISAKAFEKISQVKVDIINILAFMGSISILAIGLTLLTPFLLLSLPASALLIPMGISLMLAGSGFNSLSTMQFNTENIMDFTKSIGILALGLSVLLVPLVLATPASLLLIPIMLAIMSGALLLRFINTLDFGGDNENSNINTFMSSTKKLVDSINDFGLITLGKTAMKAALLLPLFATLTSGAHAMKAINEIGVDNAKFDNFTVMVDTVVTNITDTISRNEDKLDGAEAGLEVLTKIFNVGGNIAQTVKNMAGLTYNEYKVVNGKMVLHKTHKLGPEDFKAAGENLGFLINALVEPLSILGDTSASKFTLGGITFDNPFKDSAASKGVDFVAKIGNAFLPLSESLKTLTETGLFTDSTKVETFTQGMSSLIKGYSENIVKFADIDTVKAEQAITKIVKFNSLFEESDTENLKNISLSFERIINVFSDEPKWKAIRENLKFMSKEFRDITTSLNSLNLEKALQFEKSLKIIAQANSADVAGLIEKLTELIDVVKVQTGNVADSVDTGGKNTQIAAQKSATQTKEIKTQQQVAQADNSVMEATMSELKEVLSSIDGKLAGTLKVKSANKGTFI